jgi:O-antigen/teichoic acid export membrane protein
MKINNTAIGLSVARVFQMIILFLSIKLMTFYLSQEQIGYYYVIGSIISFFNLVFLNSPSMYLTRDLYRLNNEKKLLSSFLYYGLWIIIVALFGVLILSILNNFDIFKIDQIIYYVFLCLIFSTFYRNIVNGFNTLLKPNTFIIFSSLNVIFGLLFSILFVFYFKTAISWLSGTLLIEFTIALFALKYFFIEKQYFFKISFLKIKEVFYYCYPLTLASLFMWIQTQSFKIITEVKYSAEALSSLALGISISSGIYAGIQAILEQIFTPQFYINIKAEKIEREKEWQRLQELTLPLYVLTFFFIVAFAKYIGEIFLSQNFDKIVLYIQLGACINFVRILINNLQFITVSEKITKKMIIPSLISSSVLLILLFFIDFSTKLYLIPVSIILSFFLSLIFLYYSLAKRFNIKIPIVSIFWPSIPIVFFLFANGVFALSNFLVFSIFCIYYAGMFILFINKK